MPLITGNDMTGPPDLTLPIPAVLLVLGLGFLVGFALGLAVEYANLRSRERQLAHYRRVAHFAIAQTNVHHAVRQRQDDKEN